MILLPSRFLRTFSLFARRFSVLLDSAFDAAQCAEDESTLVVEVTDRWLPRRNFLGSGHGQ